LDGLIVRTVVEKDGLRLDYATTPSRLMVAADGTARGGGTILSRRGDVLMLQRPDENRILSAQPLQPCDHSDVAAIAGNYWCDELQARLVIGGSDGAAHAGFDGILGRGPFERMYPVAADVWIIPTRRSMDASPPGDWTLQIHRQDKQVTGLTLGCWLARGLHYRPE
jgi:D-aminopeptidase